MSDGHIIFPSPAMHYPLRAALSGFRNARKIMVRSLLLEVGCENVA
jgi:hypothetical protein